jgi:hypothetical protein
MRLGWSILLSVWAVGFSAELEVVQRTPPAMPAVELKASSKLNLKQVPECSALWASTLNPGVFWTLSDSGNKPEIVPVRADGSTVIGPTGLWLGVTLKGLKNTDWEALTSDGQGNLILGDVGNNLSRRKELAFYVFKEPALGAKEVSDFKKYTFSWPDQTVYPDPEISHDCEAIFVVRGKLYLLTKHRRDTLTDLWRAELPAVGEQAVLTKLARFDAKGMVTDASVSPDGKRLAVLTYRMAWVFDLPSTGEAFFQGPAKVAPLSPPLLSWQLEGSAWLDAQTLLIGSEQGDLFKLPLSALKAVP